MNRRGRSVRPSGVRSDEAGGARDSPPARACGKPVGGTPGGWHFVPRHANMCSLMVVCVLLPRFALSVAAGGRAELARGPVALAPEPGREPLIGEASAAAEAHGVRAGLRLGEALARCPALKLVAPDPAGVA